MRGMRKRIVADITIESTTPIKVGSGSVHLITDSPVARDASGLPVIPGTALVGMLRSSLVHSGLGTETVSEIFGSADDTGHASRLVVSAARVLDGKGDVVDGLKPESEWGSYLQFLQTILVRDHVKINHLGAADTKKKGKFDEEILPRGVRFKFRLEYFTAGGSDEDPEAIPPEWDTIIQMLGSPLFRLGGGTRKGFGKIAIVGNSISHRVFNLRKPNDLEDYLSMSSSLAAPIPGAVIETNRAVENSAITTYRLELKPEDWFLFGSGHADAESKMTPVMEKHISWNAEGRAEFTNSCVVMPATSWKGAISHRTAYHYNRLCGIFSEDLKNDSQRSSNIDEDNIAVRALFGSAKGRIAHSGSCGKVIFDDIYIPSPFVKMHVVNHVSLDRFTQGPMDGMLFSEKVVTMNSDQPIHCTIVVSNSAFETDERIRKAFESALMDVTTGLLPLGGGVMRGNGVFTGTLTWEEQIHG